MTETTTGNNQRSHVASGHVPPFDPSAITSESTTASLAQQQAMKGSSHAMINASQTTAKGV
jgi:hypothetical protein